MTSFLLYLLLWLWDNRSFDTITKANANKNEAENAYIEKDYRKAADLYQKITYGSVFVEPASRLYLAHSYFYLDSLEQARYHYKILEQAGNSAIASKANTQLAIIAIANKDTLEAINYLKTALRQVPENSKARYNYELLKKTFSGKTSTPEKTPPPPPEAPPPPPQLTPEAQQSVELAQQREELLQSLRRLNMSEDQARSILDAMKTNEAQYIYQLRRRQYFNQSERSKRVEW
jgi:tetratricopeptide (TPR) repeat protein